jgi:hypothetical protein
MRRALGQLARHHWIGVVLVAALVKLSIAGWLPLTGDEAYFASWGLRLDYGYYDHPPMAGWMTAVMQIIGDHRLLLRLPGMLTGFALAGVFWWALRGIDAQRAGLVALVILISPISLINAFTLTDTGVILFGGLSLAALIRALANNQLRYSTLAGVCLGLAFLSKYFAAGLVLAYALHFFVIDRQQWRHGVVLLLASLPFALLNLYWNYTHCWSNVLFNFINRHDPSTGFNAWTSGLYALSVLFIFLPPIVLRFIRLQPKRMPLTSPMAPTQRLAVTVLATCLGGLAFISLWREVGLHWLLWLHVFAVIALWPITLSQWQRLTGALAGWSIAHVVVIPIAIAAALIYAEQSPALKKDWLGLTQSAQLLDAAREQIPSQSAVQADPSKLLLATQSYSSAAIAQHRTGQRTRVFGGGSRYGRQDDFWTDFTQLDATDWLIFTKDRPATAMFERLFARIEVIVVDFDGQPFYFVFGQSLNAQAYIDQIIAPMLDRFYALPDWLPVGACEVKARYE